MACALTRVGVSRDGEAWGKGENISPKAAVCLFVFPGKQFKKECGICSFYNDKQYV